MSIYTQLHAAAADAAAKFDLYARECRVVAEEIVVEVCAQLGWPASKPHGAGGGQQLIGAFDGEGRYCVRFAVRLTRFGVVYDWRFFREAGAWYVAWDEHRFAVDRADKTTVAPLVSVIEADMKAGIAATFHPSRWA